MAGIILASQSPRRKQLLEWAEIDFEILVEPTEESYPPDLDPKNIAIYIARQKAVQVQHKVNNKIIIAADTIVVLGKKIIGKPKDRDDAISILNQLSGKKHQVITGVFIANN